MKKNTQIPSISENTMIEFKKAQKALLNRIKKDKKNKLEKDQ